MIGDGRHTTHKKNTDFGDGDSGIVFIYRMNVAGRKKETT
jgi:hypothetical protein